MWQFTSFFPLTQNKITPPPLSRETYLTGCLIYIFLIKSRLTSLRNFRTSWTEVTLSTLQSIWIFNFLSRRTVIPSIALVRRLRISHSFTIITTCAVSTVFYPLISGGIWIGTLWTAYIYGATSYAVSPCWTLISSDAVFWSGRGWASNTVITSSTIIRWGWKSLTSTILSSWAQKWLWTSLGTVGSIETLSTLGDRSCCSCTSTTEVSRITGSRHFGKS